METQMVSRSILVQSGAVPVSHMLGRTMLYKEDGTPLSLSNVKAPQAVAAVMANLVRDRSTTLHLAGDSTGDQETEWFVLMGKKLQEEFPNHTLLHRVWNDSNQNYDQPVTLVDAGGGRRVAIMDSGQLTYVATSVVGDIDISHWVKPNSWVSGFTRTISGRWQTTSNQRGWNFSIDATGHLVLVWSADGTSTVITKTSTAVVPYDNGEGCFVKVTLDVDNGSSGNDVRFYTSDDGVTWTQLGDTITTAGVTSIHNSTSAYQLGSITTSFTTPFSGEIGWTEIRNGIGGANLVPPLPDDWEQTTTSSTNTVLLSGSPVILLNNGSRSGQGVAYQDDTTRRPKLFAKAGQDVIFLSSGHNDGNQYAQTWATTFSTWINNIKAQLPNVPIVCVGQNPTTAPISENQRNARAGRAATVAALAVSTVGVYFVDAWSAFDDVTTQVESADGVHPTEAGSIKWADRVFEWLFWSES